jgi:hypothetical protein
MPSLAKEAPEIAGSVNKREDLNLALKDFVHQAVKGVVQPLARAGSPNYASRPLCHRRRISRATSSWAIKSPLLASARPRATLWTTYR